jgi:hypothetical protein
MHGTPPQHTAEDAPRTGDLVEVRHNGRVVSVRKVEMVMPDGSGFWLSADGADTRLYVPFGRSDQIYKVSFSRSSEDTDVNGSLEMTGGGR